MTDQIIFKSGRQIYAHRGIVGIDADLNLSEGYDGSIDWPIGYFDKDDADHLTAEDMTELADLLIARWQAFKKTLKVKA